MIDWWWATCFAYDCLLLASEQLFLHYLFTWNIQHHLWKRQLGCWKKEKRPGMVSQERIQCWQTCWPHIDWRIYWKELTKATKAIYGPSSPAPVKEEQWRTGHPTQRSKPSSSRSPLRCTCSMHGFGGAPKKSHALGDGACRTASFRCRCPLHN